MAGNIFGIDLGSYHIKIYNKSAHSFTKLKDALAIKNKKTVLATGDKAYEMFEKAPADIEVVFPMKEGVVSHFHDMQHILNNIFKETKPLLLSPQYLITVPTDVTEVEKKAFYDLLTESVAKAKNVSLVERSLADAVGLGINIMNVDGAFIVNFGDQTTEISVVAKGGIILNKLLKIGGHHMDLNIIQIMKAKEEFLIGELSAEFLRKEYGLLVDEQEDKTSKTPGRNLVTGVPKLKELSRPCVYYSIQDVMDEVVSQIGLLLERTPPMIQKHIKSEGIYICGGVANTKGLVEYLEEKLEIPIYKMERPEDVTIQGIATIIKEKELHKLTYSMNYENLRWKR